MERLNVLLFNRFRGDETHLWAADRFADGFGIVGVILVGLDVGLYELRGDKQNAVPAPA